MLKYNDYLNWKNGRSNGLHMIATHYNPSKKSYYLKNKFDLECPIESIEKNAQIIYDCCNKYLGKQYVLQYEDNATSWKEPIFVNKKEDIFSFLELTEVNKFIKPKKLRVNDNLLLNFFKIFIDVPMLNSSSNILLFGLDYSCIIVISNHGTVWFIMEDRVVIEKLVRYLESKNATVIRGQE
jgi:hypothetical protein